MALSFESQTCGISLRAGLAELHATYPELVRDASTEAVEFFNAHDAVHVIFGCNTGPRHESFTDLWSLFGTTARWRDLAKYARYDDPGLVFRMSLSDNAEAFATLFGYAPTIWRRCKRMTRKWPWFGYARHLDRSVADLRIEYNIQVLR